MRDDTDEATGTSEDVVITSELGKRPSRPPDYEAEARALRALVHELAVSPHELLQKIADMVREVCGADSSAVSILEPAVSGGVWRWHAVSGAFAPRVTAIMRCEAGPGLDVLRRNQVLLLRGAERVCDGLSGEPQIAETLLAPWDAEGQLVGMLWAIAHDPGRHFDAEDARLLSVVARFAAAAWQVAQAQSAALAESEERYQNLFNSLDEGFVVAELLFDAEEKAFDLVVLETNPSFDRMMRTTNAVGKRALEIFPDAEPSWFEAYAHVVRTGKSLRFENYLRPLDSWFDLYISRIGGVGSRRFAIVFNDITERKRTESKLRQSEERLRLVVESASDYAIFTTDVEGRIVSWNVGAERLFGWTEQEALGSHMRIVFTPEDVAAGIAEMGMRQAQETGRAADERWQVAKGGGRFYSSGILVALRADGILSGYAKIARDLTERKQLEDAQRDAHEQLEHRVRARTSELAYANAKLLTEVGERRAAEAQVNRLFSRVVAVQEEERRRIARDLHDQLGQPMTALRMSLQAADSLNAMPAVKEQLTRAQQLAGEVDESIDALTWDLRPAALDHIGLAPALSNLVTGWSERFGVAAEFVSSWPDTARLPAEIEANLYRLTQEALHNVAKHAQASHVSVLLECQQQHRVLIIEDDGSGFDPNERREESGLGLVSMRERAILAGGELTIDATPGHGTAIFVRLPLTVEGQDPSRSVG